MREHQLWKQVMGFPDYFISNHGNVRSKRRGSLQPLRPRNNGSGYLAVALCRGETGEIWQVNIHQLVYRHFIGEVADGFEINHKDLNKGNNHYQNLEQLTHQQNISHAFKIIMKRRYQERYEWANVG